jgi:hypothetical protein
MFCKRKKLFSKIFDLENNRKKSNYYKCARKIQFSKFQVYFASLINIAKKNNFRHMVQDVSCEINISYSKCSVYIFKRKEI